MSRFIFIFSLFFNFCLSSENSDTLSYIQKKNSGNYYPYIKLTDNDTLKFPIDYQFRIIIDEIRDFKLDNDYFFLKFHFDVNTIYDTLINTLNNQTYLVDPFDILLLYDESDKLFYFHDPIKKTFYPKIQDSVYVKQLYIEAEFPHKWEMRNYPFDTQYLEFILEGLEDTSIQKLVVSDDYPPFLEKEFRYLYDGLHVEEIITEKSFRVSTTKYNFPDGKREAVADRLIVKIPISRKGSFLYFKLFFGGFLSFLISFLCFFIDPKFFDTRITLNIGGIFGAIGNKYFVETSMPAVQVLTKADIINNLIIFFIILNIFVVIAQHSEKINIKVLENNKYAGLIISVLFLIINSIVVFY